LAKPKRTTRPAKRKKSSRSRTSKSKGAKAHGPIRANDGGAWALGGYFYQFVGSAALILEAVPGLDAAQAITLEIETAGQDAVQTLNNEIRLIQFKYSKDESNIPPSELAEILRALKRSQKSLIQKAKKIRWILRTNRDIGTGALALKNDPKAAKPTKTSREDAETIRKLGSQLEHEKMAFPHFRDQLMKRAQCFGVDRPDGIGAKISAYFQGLVLNVPEGQRVVEPHALDSILAGCHKPRSLRSSDIKSFAKSELFRFAQSLQVTPLEKVIPRKPVEQLLRRPGLAIGIITGHGGCGKTRSVLRSLHDVLDRQECLAAALMPGPSPLLETLPELVGRWRSEQGEPTETLTASLERLIVANRETGKKLLLFLAVDGLDETQSGATRRQHLNELLPYLWNRAQTPQQSDVVLLATCRTRKTFDQFVVIEGIKGTDPPNVEEVELGDFNRDEFHSVWTTWFESESVPEIGLIDSASQTVGGAAPAPARSKDLIALAHPALLQCAMPFSTLQRKELIDGDQKAWTALLSQYVRWFATKVTRRQAGEFDDVVSILKAVAQAAFANGSPTSSFDLDHDWIAPAKAQTQLSPLQLRRIFNEAVSCGLIISPDWPAYTMPKIEPIPWRWRFQVLSQYLRTVT
jgi:hypothetical protein